MEQQALLQREESSYGTDDDLNGLSAVVQRDSKAQARVMRRSCRISHWDPEDLVAWEAGNKLIARRNLFWSVVTVHLGYAVWSLWPVMALFMPQNVYGFSAGDKFLLGTTATLVGACLRLPYSLATAVFGGRNWTMFSAFVLLIPTIGTMVLLAHPGLPLWPYLLCAALTGLGGGNFAASMSNANAFYPQKLKGSALGIAGGIGNLGVPVIQLVGLLVIATAGNGKPCFVCGIYVALLTVATVGATSFMNNVEQHRVPLSRLRPILSAVVSTRDTWFLSMLYLVTFGSFIGFSFAFGQVLQTNFVAAGQSPAQASLHAAELAFLGPLLAALARVFGGRLADRFGGSRLSLGVFIAMVFTAGMLISASIIEHKHAGHISGVAVAGYFVGFIALFILAGLGNGSVYKMIPTIFERCSRSMEINDLERREWSRMISGIVIGLVAAFGALGGVGIDLALRQSFISTGTVTSAFWVFMCGYAAAALLTWKVYVRQITGRVHAAEPATSVAVG